MRRPYEMSVLSIGILSLLASPVAAAGLSIGGENGVNAGVDTRDGLGASASVGGSRGVNVDANVTGSVGGANGVNADIGATLGGTGGTDLDVDVGVGGGGAGGNGTGGSGDGSGSGLTPQQVQAFRNMRQDERQKLLVRCGSVNAGGYDRQLAKLCALLQLSAKR